MYRAAWQAYRDKLADFRQPAWLVVEVLDAWLACPAAAQRNQWDEALAQAEWSVRAAAEAGHVRFLFHSKLHLAYILIATGRHDPAMQVLSDARSLVMGTGF